MEKQFILWDPREGVWSGGSDGMIGRVGIDNVSIAVYAEYLDGEKTARDLAVGEACPARFSLSGSSGVYQVIRVA